MLGKKRSLLSQLSTAFGLVLVVALITLALIPLIKPWLALSTAGSQAYQQSLSREESFVRAELEQALQLIEGLRSQAQVQLQQTLEQRVDSRFKQLQYLHASYQPRLVSAPLKELMLSSVQAANQGSAAPLLVLDQKGALLPTGDEMGLPLNSSVLSLLQLAIESEPQGFVDVDAAPETQVSKQLWYYQYFEPMDWYLASAIKHQELIAQQQQQALAQLAQLTYLDDGYLMVLDQQGRVLMDASQGVSVGADALILENSQQQRPFERLYQQAMQHGRASADVDWTRPHSAYEEPKRWHALLDEQWQWLIVSGVYSQPLQLASERHAKQQHAAWQKHALHTGLAALAVLVFALLLQRLLQQRIQVRIKQDSAVFDKALKAGKELDSSALRYQEWDALAIVVNKQVRQCHELEHKLLEQSTQDPLTGAVNRRELLNNLEQELSRCARYILPMTYLSIEISQFKAVVDEHGYAAGDAVLKAFCTRLQDCLRNVDVVGRIGGEEFAAILPQTAVAHAGKVAERLHSTLSQHNFMHQGKALRVGLSLGAVSIEAGCRYQLNEILDRSHQMLNDAKQQPSKAVASSLLAPSTSTDEHSLKPQLPEGLLKASKKD